MHLCVHLDLDAAAVKTLTGTASMLALAVYMNSRHEVLTNQRKSLRCACGPRLCAYMHWNMGTRAKTQRESDSAMH